LRENSKPHEDSDDIVVDAVTEIWEHTTWRSIGRFVLVLAVTFLLLTMHDLARSGLEKADLKLFDSMMMTVLAPGSFAFYWSAGLQTQNRAIALQSARAAFLFLLVVSLGIWLFNIVFVIAYARLAGISEFLWLPAIAVVLGFPLDQLIVNGVPAFAGGWLIDKAKRHNVRSEFVIAALSILIALWSTWLFDLVDVKGAAYDMKGIGETAPNVTLNAWFQAAWVFGITGIGLWISGFPKVLATARSGHMAKEPAVAAQDKPARAFDPVRPTLYCGVLAVVVFFVWIFLLNRL